MKLIKLNVLSRMRYSHGSFLHFLNVVHIVTQKPGQTSFSYFIQLPCYMEILKVSNNNTIEDYINKKRWVSVWVVILALAFLLEIIIIRATEIYPTRMKKGSRHSRTRTYPRLSKREIVWLPGRRKSVQPFPR